MSAKILNMAATLRKAWDNVMRRRFLRMGIPFIICIAGGSFFLKQFSSIRYEFRQGRKLSKQEAEKLGLISVDVNAVQTQIMKDTDDDQWENIRGPRPWEDSKTVQTELRQNLENEQTEKR